MALNLLPISVAEKVIAIRDPNIVRYTAELLSEDYRLIDHSSYKAMLYELEQAVREWITPYIEIPEFPHFYITNGITDGLNNYTISKVRIGETISIYKGDYEWVRHYGHRSPNAVSGVGNKNLYISQPNACNGNYIDSDEFRSMQNGYKDVALDCAYFGCAGNYYIRTHDNVSTIFLGLSKTLGLPDLRIGFVFTREPMRPMHGLVTVNQYVNPTSITIAKKLIQKFPADYLNKKYSDQQYKICKDLSTEHAVYSSETVFLATTNNPAYDSLKRGGENRLCITSLFKPFYN